MRAVRELDASQSWVVQALMSLRRLGWKKSDAAGSPAKKKFLELPSGSEEVLLAGIVGRFWRLDSGFLPVLSPEEFHGFRREGHARAVIAFWTEAGASGRTVLHTETRVQCFGAEAARSFRAYWVIVGPFSGLIRHAMLGLIKKRAESADTMNV
ncbi:MAG: hypothetical protein HYX26_11000 [Acidobacteriales bacterium]|nr:hypothetical protein [Terriglobales bacterium]